VAKAGYFLLGLAWAVAFCLRVLPPQNVRKCPFLSLVCECPASATYVRRFSYYRYPQPLAVHSPREWDTVAGPISPPAASCVGNCPCAHSTLWEIRPCQLPGMSPTLRLAKIGRESLGNALKLSLQRLGSRLEGFQLETVVHP
jgi:hypothetical protein